MSEDEFGAACLRDFTQLGEGVEDPLPRVIAQNALLKAVQHCGLHHELQELIALTTVDVHIGVLIVAGFIPT